MKMYCVCLEGCSVRCMGCEVRRVVVVVVVVERRGEEERRGGEEIVKRRREGWSGCRHGGAGLVDVRIAIS